MRKDRLQYLSIMLWSVWFGFLGADRFYLAQFNKRHSKWAIWKLVTLGGLGTWWLADLIYIGAHRNKLEEIIADKWTWRKYSRAVALTSTVFTAICILLSFVVPPQVSISPNFGDKGTRFNVQVMFARPLAKITEKTIDQTNQNVMESIEYKANIFGTLSFVIPSASYEPGEYKCIIETGNFSNSVPFSIIGGGPPPPQLCIVTPEKVVQGTEFVIKGYG
ncbi:MAG: TM2 domain-containing protein, partial [Dehalococcoidia bacterium]